jgi:hypothetical protein
MGNNSENLVFEAELSSYRGAILSPVNSDEDVLGRQVARMKKELNDFEVIFDSQLYAPRSERGKLPTWGYFPKDVETADLSSSEDDATQCASQKRPARAAGAAWLGS